MEKVSIILIARAEQAKEPWVWKLVKNFNLKVNILKANIEESYGWVELSLEGPQEEIGRATSWLLTTGMHVEAKTRSLGVS